MTQTINTFPVRTEPASRRSRRWKGWAAAATGVAAAAAAVALLVPGQAPSASAAVLTASEHTAKADTGRVELFDSDGTSAAKAEFDGSDYRVAYAPDANGSLVVTVIGHRRITSTPAGQITGEVTVGDDQIFTPFSRAAAHVVRAALSDAAVRKIGTEQVRGKPATHYRVSLSAASRTALDGLPQGDRVWFDLEQPGDIDTVDVWVADDLIRRVTVAGDRNSTTEFWDFGSDITIKRP